MNIDIIRMARRCEASRVLRAMAVAMAFQSSLLCTATFAQVAPDGLDAPVAERSEFPTKAIAVAKLPVHVAREEGKFTLFADFQDQREGQVMLYVINNTDQVREFEAEDYDYYIKQECQDEKGNWVRSQPHVYSTCGNSFYKPRMLARSYLQILGWQPKEGRETKLRYRFNSDAAVASNVGVGRVADAMVRFAKVDEMGLRIADIETIKSALFDFPWGDWDELEKNDPNWPERFSELLELAFQRLEELPAKDSVPVLIQCWEKGSVYCNEHVAFGLLAKAPDQWRNLILRDLKSADKDRRLVAIALASSWTKLNDPEIVEVVFGMIDKQLDNNNRMIIEALAAMPRAAERLNAAIAGNDFPEVVRSHMLFSLAQARKEGPIDVTVSAVPQEDYDRFAVAVALKNTSDRPVRFAYLRPEEIVAIAVAVETRGEDGKAKSVAWAPKSGIRWLAPTDGGKVQEITLDPGASHGIRIELTDYFKFPNCSGRARFACRLPGVQPIPQIAEDTISFGILSLDSAQAEPKKGVFEKAMELEKQGR